MRRRPGLVAEYRHDTAIFRTNTQRLWVGVLFVVVVLLLGTILDSSSILLITIPLVLPALAGFGTDLVWFGIVTLLAVEIGLLSPPFGIAVFVIRATLGGESPIELRDIFLGAAPFAAVMFAVLLLVIAFPQLATALL